MSEIRLAGFLPRSSVNGPGIRAVLWVQGCPLRCDGCFNPGLMPFSDVPPVRVGKLAQTILTLDYIDGVTFSGGEPFAQASPLADLGELLRPAGLSVITFTGFTWDRIRTKNRKSWDRLLAITDVLVAGPFSREKCAGTCGSHGLPGKQIVHLSEGKPVSIAGYDPLGSRETGQEIEFTIAPDGRMEITGFPGSRLLGVFGSLSQEENRNVTFQPTEN